MKKVLIAVILAAFVAILAAPTVFAAQEVSWGQLKCEFNPDACPVKGNG